MERRIRSPILPMSGLSPATRAPAIQTGSWLAPVAPASAHRLAGVARLALAAIAVVVSLAPWDAFAARRARTHALPPPEPVSTPESSRPLPYPELELPLQITGSQ